MTEERWSVRGMHRGYVMLSEPVERNAKRIYTVRLDFDLSDLPPLPEDALLLTRGLPDEYPLLLPHADDHVALVRRVENGYTVERGLEDRLADFRRRGVANAGIVLDTSSYGKLYVKKGFLYRPREAGVGPDSAEL